MVSGSGDGDDDDDDDDDDDVFRKWQRVLKRN